MAGLKRREVVGLGVAGALWPLLPGLADETSARGAAEAPARSDLPPARPGARPRNIIMMVADGMSLGTLTLADAFSRRVRGRGTTWLRLLAERQAAYGVMDMQSLDSLVTDSAAASSSWGSGARIFNTAVNMLPDGVKLTPLAPLVKASGRGMGLVTTTTITHATPAGFAAVQPSRDDEAEIAPQYLNVVDVLLGGGAKFFDADLRSDKHDLFADYRAQGYGVMRSRAELKAAMESAAAGPGAAPAGARAKLLGIFSEKHLPFTLDWRDRTELAERVPTLAEMTEVALQRLAAQPDGFLLQVEGGRVDHAAHSNDAAAIVWEQLAFDEALDVVLRFVAGRATPDTLVIITSDHGNSNPGLIGLGDKYDGSNTAFEQLMQARASFATMEQRLQALRGRDHDTSPTDACIAIVREAAGIEINKSEARAVMQSFLGTPPPTMNRQLAKWEGQLGAALTNYNGIGWTGLTHTSDWVLLTALGPGQEHFGGFVENTRVFEIITDLFEIKHRNPRLSPEKARGLKRSARRREAGVHWA